MRLEHSIDIDAPLDRVWGLTLDVESWPEHTPTMTSVQRLDTDEFDVGSKVRIKQPGQAARVWTVSELQAEERFAWSTRAMGTKMTATHELRPAGSTTTNTLIVDIEGPLSGIVGRLVRRPILSAIRTENEGFKTAAES
ncbi:MAG: SRPBCC family protein [Acidimicrobiales bacterium]